MKHLLLLTLALFAAFSLQAETYDLNEYPAATWTLYAEGTEWRNVNANPPYRAYFGQDTISWDGGSITYAGDSNWRMADNHASGRMVVTFANVRRVGGQFFADIQIVGDVNNRDWYTPWLWVTTSFAGDIPPQIIRNAGGESHSVSALFPNVNLGSGVISFPEYHYADFTSGSGVLVYLDRPSPLPPASPLRLTITPNQAPTIQSQ